MEIPIPRGSLGALEATISRSSSPFSAYDEHLIDLDELERRLSTSRTNGLSAATALALQEGQKGLNLLPTDTEAGHGAIHELVAVLRDGTWLHTRAENLLPGDVISLQPFQCVPADVRIIESDGMWVSFHAIDGTTTELPRTATPADSSMFSDGGERIAYMDAQNIALYGSNITRGSGKAIVLRIGASTVLGSVSSAVEQRKGESGKHYDVPLPESIKQLGVSAHADLLPSAISRVSALVVEHPEAILSRAVVACSLDVSPPMIVEVDDAVLANETPRDDLERDLVAQVLAHAEDGSHHAHKFIKALTAIHSRIETSAEHGETRQARVPTLPPSSPIAPPVVIDPARDQSAVRRFGSLFSEAAGSPRAKSRSKATLLRGRLSECEVLVHFDEEQRAHVVLLVGPTREILSRCALETMELHALQDAVADLEERGQTVISLAELSLDPDEYPVGVKFDLTSANFPTSGLSYLGSLALAEKLHPEVVLMGAFAQAAGVRLLVCATNREFSHLDAENQVSTLASGTADDTDEEEEGDNVDDPVVNGRKRVHTICDIPIELREAATGRLETVNASVFPSSALSVSNTLRQWRRVALDQAITVFDGSTPMQIELLVETLQELGECVALAASGSAHALAVCSADVGFAVPATDVVDLCETAADVVLRSTTCPRSDAIRLIEAVKKFPRTGVDASASTSKGSSENESRAKATMVNLLRETLNVGRMLGIEDRELRQCFEHAFHDVSQQTMTPRTFAAVSPLRPPSPIRGFSPAGKRPKPTMDAEESVI